MWLNSFKVLLQLHLEPNKLLNNIFGIHGLKSDKNVLNSILMKGFQQGGDLTLLAKSLKIPINPNFSKEIVVSNNINSVRLNNISLNLLGPTKKTLDKLRNEWTKMV